MKIVKKAQFCCHRTYNSSLLIVNNNLISGNYLGIKILISQKLLQVWIILYKQVNLLYKQVFIQVIVVHETAMGH